MSLTKVSYSMTQGAPVNVLDFGADPTGTTDSTAAIQAAIDSLANNQTKGVVELNGTFKCNTGLTLDVSYVRLQGLNAKLDFTSLASGAAITVTGEGGGVIAPYYQAFGGITGIELEGPGKAVSGTVGLLFDTASEPGASHTMYEGLTVYSFETGHSFKNNSYIVHFYTCDIWGCGTCVNMPSGGNNYGERVAYFGCTIYNSDFAVSIFNPNGAFHFTNCSLDYNGVQVVVSEGRVFLTDCHIEAANYASPPFVTYPNNGATIVIKGGWLLCTGTNTSTIFQSQTTEAQGGGIFVRDVSMNNLGVLSLWKTGVGRFQLTNPISYDVTDNPRFASQYENLLTDGSFEGTIVWDAIINDDTAPITSRTTGANIALTNSSSYARTGTKSLRAAKTGGSGSNAGFIIFAPLSNFGNLGTFKGFYRKPGSETGTVFFSPSYVNLQINGGIPVVARSAATGTLTVVFTASAVDWTQISTGQPMVHAPSWATHYALDVNMISFSAGSLYFDDFEFFEY